MTDATPQVHPPTETRAASVAGSGSARPRVVIVGGGFAGLHAALSCARLAVDVTLVDRRNHHTFQPLLYQVALAVLSPADIAQPIRGILRNQTNAQVLMDEVTHLDGNARRLTLASGAALNYDYLVLATGATHSYFGHDDWEPFAPGLKSIEDALEIRRRVLLAFELAERQMQEQGWHPPLNFVVIGGGPTGVELAGSIIEIAHHLLRHDFRHIDPAQARVLLLDGGPRVLAAYPPDLSARAEQALTRLGVEVHTRTHVTGIGPGWVQAKTGSEEMRLEAAVTLWAAGVNASPLGGLLGCPLDGRGCVFVNGRLNPPGRPEIFVLGDLAHVEQDGRPVPGVAQPAMQMGDFVGRAIGADLAGRPRPAFHYFDKGDMATIGRKAAVARIQWPFRAHWSGLPAWLTW
ncbi:MAG TPA: NAD(P)/FAD-dependent oxidoreductase, partial [Terracidiphilus sp.]|nr:NAD(P)/FAD-dependent oxidoreductase [Terracidiphilus sp.]